MQFSKTITSGASAWGADGIRYPARNVSALSGLFYKAPGACSIF